VQGVEQRLAPFRVDRRHPAHVPRQMAFADERGQRFLQRRGRVRVAHALDRQQRVAVQRLQRVERAAAVREPVPAACNAFVAIARARAITTSSRPIRAMAPRSQSC